MIEEFKQDRTFYVKNTRIPLSTAALGEALECSDYRRRFLIPWYAPYLSLLENWIITRRGGQHLATYLLLTSLYPCARVNLCV